MNQTQQIDAQSTETTAELNSAIGVAETFVSSLDGFMGQFEGLLNLFSLLGLGAGEGSENSTAQLEDLIRKILLGEEGEGGLRSVPTTQSCLDGSKS
jgi:hypothetical protein